MGQVSREQFAQQVVEVVRSKFPLVHIARAQQQHFSVLVNGHVASLENLFRMCTLQPDHTRRHVERWMVELLRASEGSPDQNAGYEQLKDRVMPMVLWAGSEAAGDAMVSQPFVDDLVIAYAVDSDRTIAYILREHFEDWGVSLEELHQQAIDNLVEKSESLSAHAAQDEDGTINLILFQTMDGYDASRILLPTLHERLREHLGSPFAAGIPNRDILLCFRNDEQVVQRLRRQIATDFQQMPHQVTERLLLVTADGVASYE